MFHDSASCVFKVPDIDQLKAFKKKMPGEGMVENLSPRFATHGEHSVRFAFLLLSGPNSIFPTFLAKSFERLTYGNLTQLKDTLTYVQSFRLCSEMVGFIFLRQAHDGLPRAALGLAYRPIHACSCEVSMRCGIMVPHNSSPKDVHQKSAWLKFKYGDGLGGLANLVTQQACVCKATALHMVSLRLHARHPYRSARLKRDN